ncbi:MAG: GvpL/GvpF family gas vesicle protein [Nanoarchaeota archaeon]|nr:GvpL/GvpF family gas vesicle protein [Nanoarchaeota archaeon]
MNYVYCIINKNIKQSFGYIGVEDKEVYTIPHKDVSLVVHDSDKEAKLNVEDHLICHQYVISFLTKKFNTVIPFGMNTFIKKEKAEPFLEKNYETFKKKLESLKDKSEFIVQIFYDPEPKKSELKGSVKDYILKQKKLRKDVLEELTKFRKKFYNQIKEIVDDIKIKEDEDDEKPLLSMSCLVHKNKVKELQKSLRNISSRQGFRVHFSGPWTIYSFV